MIAHNEYFNKPQITRISKEYEVAEGVVQKIAEDAKKECNDWFRQQLEAWGQKEAKKIEYADHDAIEEARLGGFSTDEQVTQGSDFILITYKLAKHEVVIARMQFRANLVVPKVQE